MSDIKHIVYLHGYLGDKFTREPITLYARDIRDVVKGLSCGLGKEFLMEIRSGSWHVSTGKRTTDSDLPTEEDNLVTEDTSGFPIKEEEVHIYPRVEGNITLSILGSLAGALGASAATVTAISTLGGVLGSTAAIAGASVAGMIINVGLTLAATAALSAVVQAISNPSMDYDNAEVDRAASFLFNGVVNVVEQGGAVPLVYGKHLTGSTVISVNMVSEELGESANELSPQDRNFLLPLSANWEAHATTVETVVTVGVGVLKITKTTGTQGDGALLLTTLERSTRYRLIVKFNAPYEGAYNRPDSLHTWRQYQGLHLQYRNNDTQLAYEVEHPVFSLGSDGTPSVEFSASMEFTTVATPIDEKLLFYADPDMPAGTETVLTYLKVEKI
jgi:predicted phage tail protein